MRRRTREQAGAVRDRRAEEAGEAATCTANYCKEFAVHPLQRQGMGLGSERADRLSRLQRHRTGVMSDIIRFAIGFYLMKPVKKDKP